MTTPKRTKGRPDYVDVHVGEQLKARYKLIGMSQDQLAKHVGLTFQQIQKYSTGVNRISAGRLYAFANILEVPVTYFYEGLDDKGRKAEKLSLNQIKALRLLPMASQRAQKAVIALLEEAA